MSDASGFVVAPFAADGESIGTGVWKFEALTPRWVGVAREFLDVDVPAFTRAWPDELNLGHIETRFTETGDAAMATFLARGVIASSLVMLGGTDPEADRELCVAFVESLRNSDPVRVHAKGDRPFQSLLELPDRPLLGVVAWHFDVSPFDAALVRELGINLAGAYFSRRLEIEESGRD
jgi:hypothetical protein